MPIPILLADIVPMQLAQPDAWQSQVITFVLMTLSTIVTAAVPLLIMYVRKRLKLQISAEQEARIADIVTRGIHYAEERTAAAIKAKTWGGSPKIDQATEYIRGELERFKLPQMAADVVRRQIESRLPEARRTLPSGTPKATTPEKPTQG